MVPSRLRAALRRIPLSSLRELFWPTGASKAYAVCALVALAVPWLHEYPAGIDLPEHAHLFQVLAHYFDPKTAYRVFYFYEFYTPYAVLYMLAMLFAKIGGALFAVKVLISLCVLMTPAAMTRWLRAIGGEPSLGVLGFAVVFGFGYLWGFLSFVMSIPISFLYLGTLAHLLDRPTWAGRLKCAVLAIVLFFTHGIAFGFTMIVGGIACLLRRGPVKTMAFDVLHFIPAVLVIVPWRLKHHGVTSAPFSEPPTVERFTTLFSGATSAQADFVPAVCVLAAVCLFVAVGRPTLSYRPIRLLPFAFALLGLFTIPEWVSDTWLVGSRFVQFVYCFGLGAFDFHSPSPDGRRLRAVAAGIVLVALSTFHYRMGVFNRELGSLKELEAMIPPGEDVRFFLGDDTSDAFGEGALHNVVAWITAEQGGFLAEDSSMYFQIPLQKRHKVPPPGEFHYLLTRGTRAEARERVGPSPEHLATRGKFHLFETKRTRLSFPGLTLVRFGQDWRKPRQGLSVDSKPLSVGGRRYAEGAGTHARSVLQLKVASGMRRIHGAVGIDDGASEDGAALFRISDGTRRNLFESPPLARGDRATPFDVSLEGVRGDVFLLVDAIDDRIEGAHADWLDVAATP
jgi:hypothetical protein